MPLVIADRVKETTTTTGTGTITLAGAATGFRSFSVVGNGNTTYYAIVDPAAGAWETGIGTYSTTGPTLARTTVLESSNGGSAVNFAAGTKDVFVTYPAARSVFSDGFNASGTWGISISGNAATVTNGVYTSGSYADPAWITSLAGSKISGNISGNAANVTGTVAVANGGTGGTTQAAARTGLGATTVGANLFTLTNPGAITFPRINADNTVSTLDAATFRSAIGAGTGSGTVTSVALSGGTTGLTVSGSPITGSGTITLAGALAVTNGGTGATSAPNARANLGATTVGSNLFTLTNPNAITFLRINAGNSVSAVDAATFRSDIGAGVGDVTTSGTQTLTNKRINPRVSSTTTTATLTPDINSFDQFNLTAQSSSLSVAAPSGTPVDGQRIIIRILDNGSPQSISWDATYTVIGATMPTTTTASKTTYVGCIYNVNNNRWDVVAVNTQA